MPRIRLQVLKKEHNKKVNLQNFDFAMSQGFSQQQAQGNLESN